MGNRFPEHKNCKLTFSSQSLRKNMTKEERRLWYNFLKNIPIHFNRQKVFGDYIVDFYCAKYKLVIELDGSQHYLKEGIHKDIERDAYFNGLGIKVLRYSNADVNYRFVEVCEDILNNMEENREVIFLSKT